MEEGPFKFQYLRPYRFTIFCPTFGKLTLKPIRCTRELMAARHDKTDPILFFIYLWAIWYGTVFLLGHDEEKKLQRTVHFAFGERNTTAKRLWQNARSTTCIFPLVSATASAYHYARMLLETSYYHVSNS